MRILNDRDKAKVCRKSLHQVVPLSFNGSTFGSSPGAVTKEPGLRGSQGVLPNGKACLSCQEKAEEALTGGRERKEAAQWQEAACTPVARGGAGIRPGGVRPSWGEGGVISLSSSSALSQCDLETTGFHFTPVVQCPSSSQPASAAGPKGQPVLFALCWCRGSRLGGHL